MAIESWWHRIRTLRMLKDKLLKLHNEVIIISKVMAKLINDNIKFEDAQGLLLDDLFVRSMNTFLHALPRDPNINEKNILIMSKSVRVISSAFIINKYPESVLTSTINIDNDVREVKDDSIEAAMCYVTAKTITKSMYKFTCALLSYCNDNTASVYAFRQQLISYRSIARAFFTSMKKWKDLDAQRFIQALELSYQQCYSVVIQIRGVGPDMRDDSVNEVLKHATLQLAKLEESIVSILGGDFSQTRLEELRAQVETSLTEYHQHIHDDEKNTRSSNHNVDLNSLQDHLRSAQSDNSSTEALDKNILLVEKLAEIAGLENEQLAYEICLNPAFCLDNAPDPTTSLLPLGMDFISYVNGKSTPKTHQEMAERIKTSFLLSIRYKIYWSVVPFITTGEDIQVGAVIPVSVHESSNSFVSARVTSVSKIYFDDDTNPRLQISVVHLCDGISENISMSRVKNSSIVDPAPLVGIIADLQAKILSMSPKSQQSSMAQRSLDLTYFANVLQNQAMNAKELLTAVMPLFFNLQMLQAPVRAEAMELWLNSYIENYYKAGDLVNDVIKFLPLFFEYISACIHELQRDMANYYISSLSPILQQHGVTFLRNKFLTRVQHGTVSVNQVVTLMMEVLSTGAKRQALCDELIEALGSQGSYNPVLPLVVTPEITKYVVAKAYTVLLQRPYRLDSVDVNGSIPETLLFERNKLSKVRDDIDVLALQLAFVICVKQILAKPRTQVSASACSPCSPNNYKGGVVLTLDEENEFQRRLNILLRDGDVSLSSIVTEVTTSGIIKVLTRAKGDSCSPTIISQWEEEVKKEVTAIIDPGNPILVLFTKRIYKVMYRVLLEQPYEIKLGQYSMNSSQTKIILAQIMKEVSTVFTLHSKLFTPIYTSILTSNSLQSALL